MGCLIYQKYACEISNVNNGNFLVLVINYFDTTWLKRIYWYRIKQLNKLIKKVLFRTQNIYITNEMHLNDTCILSNTPKFISYNVLFVVEKLAILFNIIKIYTNIFLSSLMSQQVLQKKIHWINHHHINKICNQYQCKNQFQ